ncbi:2-C-methyl-D-erythritol 4-phosphate cytidylyltransferase [Sedimenticola selenatireducens]|uniref:2-C-methyl-D-erythritol 4-phosphate cytidylyltransferase n=1 Tax=Sedimenticola selenatireducens TaxID=191960 RepID=A0A558DK40_9GAMM|nr:2-C-methyl-D-erythritol 4-phosphate cytidylyltransferase [Sedimenticola selenatireducens]TVO76269.1 2-C-methyl-D-erythritol 4-phosphate cytidylyltransferase [Sedimenticola selenatireducens]TVT61379.1 MAG: 2-C-methyl-D-erythritol 4-phosphate cytidylyltransferase [Sedimenticola selenatireducens]
MKAEPRYWAVVPAAGIGTRMGSDVPKQYLLLNNRPVIEHALQALLKHPKIVKVIVAIADSDHWWANTSASRHSRVQRVLGGTERADSVLNGLLSLQGDADADDWVLVHDAARPCLHRTDLENLIETLRHHAVGGLLGYPLSDTIKRVNDQASVLETLPREQLWRAFTPQMFRYGALQAALECARSSALQVTDEASAIELAGLIPQLVEGRSDNIKITRPEDLELAHFYLNQHSRDQE